MHFKFAMAHGEVPRGSRTHFQKCQNVLIYDDTPPEAKHEKIPRSLWLEKKTSKKETARLCHCGWKDASGGKWLSSLIHSNCCCWSRKVEFNSSQSVVKEFEDTFGMNSGMGPKVVFPRLAWWQFRRSFMACHEKFMAEAVSANFRKIFSEVAARNKTFEVNFSGWVFK